MAIQQYDIPNALRGDTFEKIDFELYESDGTTAIDLTGATIFMYLKTSKTQGQKVKQFEVGSGFTIDDAVNGKFSLDKQVIKIPVGSYKYDIQFFLSSGDSKTYLEGAWNIIQDVTDRE